jgi:hypothetical protein
MAFAFSINFYPNVIIFLEPISIRPDNSMDEDEQQFSSIIVQKVSNSSISSDLIKDSVEKDKMITLKNSKLLPNVSMDQKEDASFSKGDSSISINVDDHKIGIFTNIGASKLVSLVDKNFQKVKKVTQRVKKEVKCTNPGCNGEGNINSKYKTHYKTSQCPLVDQFNRQKNSDHLLYMRENIETFSNHHQSLREFLLDLAKKLKNSNISNNGNIYA